MYADRAAFELAFGAAEAADLEGSSFGRLDKAIAEASAQADSFLAARYATPVPFAGLALQQATLDLARFRLWDSRSPEEVRNRQQDALKWLRDVATGKAQLLDAVGLPVPVNTAATCVIAATVRPMTYGVGFEVRYGVTE